MERRNQRGNPNSRYSGFTLGAQKWGGHSTLLNGLGDLALALAWTLLNGLKDLALALALALALPNTRVEGRSYEGPTHVLMSTSNLHHPFGTSPHIRLAENTSVSITCKRPFSSSKLLP